MGQIDYPVGRFATGIRRNRLARTQITAIRGVAGVQTQAFVEAYRSRSVLACELHKCRTRVQTPAFVERRNRARRRTCATRTCGRRSDAVNIVADPRRAAREHPGAEMHMLGVSPEFRLRPSLSAARRSGPTRTGVQSRVAGVQTPAFVERSSRMGRAHASPAPSCVAGVQTPAFVERAPISRVGPRRRSCRRSSDSGLR